MLDRGGRETAVPRLITTLGAKGADELGMILPHEHIFVDLRTWDQPGYGEAEAADVVGLMAPFIAEARGAGVSGTGDARAGRRCWTAGGERRLCRS